MRLQQLLALLLVGADGWTGGDGTPIRANVLPRARGANYVPSYSRNPVQTWVDYDHATVDRELGFAASARLNTVRVFLHSVVWRFNAALLLRNMGDFVGACHSHGVRPLFVLFDSDFGNASVSPGFITSGEYKTAGWVPNPGEALMGREHWAEMDAYVRDIAAHFGSDERILGWDIINEPHFLNGTVPVDFIGHYLELTNNLTTQLTTLDTIMPGGPLPQFRDRVQATERALSFHDYGGPEMQAEASALKAAADAAGKPVFASETGGWPASVNPGSKFAGFCRSTLLFETVGVGWFFWELVIHPDQFSPNGVFWPNGSLPFPGVLRCIRNPTELLCAESLCYNTSVDSLDVVR